MCVRLHPQDPSYEKERGQAPFCLLQWSYLQVTGNFLRGAEQQGDRLQGTPVVVVEGPGTGTPGAL